MDDDESRLQWLSSQRALMASPSHSGAPLELPAVLQLSVKVPGKPTHHMECHPYDTIGDVLQRVRVATGITGGRLVRHNVELHNLESTLWLCGMRSEWDVHSMDLLFGLNGGMMDSPRLTSISRFHIPNPVGYNTVRILLESALWHAWRHEFPFMEQLAAVANESLVAGSRRSMRKALQCVLGITHVYAMP